MEESGTKLHIPLVLKYFVLFPQKLSVCGRVSLYLPPYPRIMGVSHMVMEIYLSFNGENSRQISDGKAPQTTGK